MDQDHDLSEDEVSEVYDHLQAMMDAISRLRTSGSDPERRRGLWDRYFQHQAQINRLIPPTGDRPSWAYPCRMYRPRRAARTPTVGPC